MKSLRYAAYLSLGYVLTAGLYIRVSSHVAARLAKNVTELESMERLKGFAFVVLTGVLLLGLAWFFFSRLQRSNEERAKERQALMLVQSKAYAGEIAATVAHDFNNLMMVLRAGVDDLAEDADKLGHSSAINEMRKALDGAKNLTERLARAARGERAGRQEIHSLSEIVEETARLIRRLPRLEGRTVEVAAPGLAMATLDRVVIEQIVVNLLLNAADACGRGGTIRLEVTESGQHVLLAVHDSGPGISDSDHMAVFEPFRSTKGGMGLGLLSVRACAEAGGGKLRVGRSPLGGAQFDVTWPKRTNTQAVASTAA